MREHYGGGTKFELVNDLELGMPRRQGCLRLVHTYANSTDLTISLPTEDLVAGGDPQVVVVNDPDDGAEDFAVGEDITLAAGKLVACYYTSAGWKYDQRNCEVGTPLTLGRIPYSIDLRGATTYFGMSTHLRSIGWDGTSPVAVTVTIHENSIIGATGPSPAFAITGLPSGSTVLLHIKPTAYISGRGGRGGRGGDTGTGLLAQAGAAGGTGLYTRVPTVIINEGTIQGGGGGGGGGASSGSIAGSGGGGGAGYTAAQGGLGGTVGGQAGYSGATNLGGSGGGSGVRAGGAGGAPGSAGSSAGAAGGAGGLSIDGYSYCTFIATGTILGGTA